MRIAQLARPILLAVITVASTAFAGGTERLLNDEATGSRDMHRLGMAAINVRIGGGVEGQTGELQQRLAPGPLWGLTLEVKPLRVMGLEAGYSGSAFELDNQQAVGDSGAIPGVDVLRNGGHFIATVNAPTTFIQPYVLGGIGVDRMTYRAPDGPQFRDDTMGRVPVGAGIRGEAGAAVVDVRANYNVLFSQDFAGSDGTRDSGGTYNVALQIGGQF